MSVHTDIADAVYGLLDPAGGPWSLAFSRERVWRPLHEPGDLAAPVVSVAPLRVEREPASRAHDQVDYIVGVMLRKRLAAPEAPDAEMDTLDTLADELLAAVNRTTAAGAAYRGAERDPFYDIDDLHKHQTFTTVIEITYRALVAA